MLIVPVSEKELWDEAACEFITVKECSLKLEHSLRSVAQWEAKWHTPFLKKGRKFTEDELLDYIRCMTLNGPFDFRVYQSLSEAELTMIKDYIADPYTATTIYDNTPNKNRPSGNTETAETLYYDMAHFGIPFDCDKWHLNRLIMLLRVCAVRESDSNKMDSKTAAKQNAALNAARRKRHRTRG